MFINAVLFIPQALKLHKAKDTKGLSLLTVFVGFNFIRLFTILHGYLHKDYVLMEYILTLFLASIVTGIYTKRLAGLYIGR